MQEDCWVVSWYVPAEHCVHTVAASAEYFPAGHGMIPKPPVVGQKAPALHGSHAARPSAGPYLPEAQEIHKVEPELAEYRPKKQLVQDVASIVEEYLPTGQAVQLAPSTNCPAAHTSGVGTGVGAAARRRPAGCAGVADVDVE